MLGRGDRVEPGTAGAVDDATAAQCVQVGDGMADGPDRRECVEIAAIGGLADLEIAPQVADPLAHGNPVTVHSALPVPRKPHDAEVLGAVDDGLDAEHAPLVVHLDPVAADAVLEAAGFGPPPALTVGVAPYWKASV